VPVRASVVVEGWALLVKVSVAFAAPVVNGLKVTVKEVLCPAGIVTGSDRPPTLNTVLFEVAAVTVMLAPLAVRLPDAEPLDPVTTLPRPRVVGFTESCPFATAVPDPDNAIVRVGFDAFEVIVTLPLAFPPDDGLNDTLKVALCPAVSVTGVEIPLTLKTVPLTAT
jgi:hypothetical protein